MSSNENNLPLESNNTFNDKSSQPPIIPPKPIISSSKVPFGEQSKFKEAFEKFNAIVKNNNAPPMPKKGSMPKRSIKRQHSFHINKSISINSGKNDTNKDEMNNNNSIGSGNSKGPRGPLKRVQSMSFKFQKVVSGSVDTNSKPPLIPPKPKFSDRPTSAPRPHRPRELFTSKVNDNEIGEIGGKGMQTSKSDLSLHSGLGNLNIDEKGRKFVEGKPRDANYYSLNLDFPEKKKRSLKGIAKGLIDLLPSRSHNEDTVNAFLGKEEDESILNTLWVSTKRKPKTWKELDLSKISQDIINLVDKSVLKEGFHIEFGDSEAEQNDFKLELSHKSEYISYYTTYLYPIEHVHYLGYDEETSLYWIISLEVKPKNRKRDFIRVLVRNRKDYCRYCIETHNSMSEKGKGSASKLSSLYKFVPEIEKVKFFKSKSQELSQEFHSMELKEIALGSRYKFGVLYVKPNQTEDEIFANNSPSPDFEEFLDFLGERVELKGFDKYSGGLDTKNNGTGSHSVYTSIHDIEIMFHVCTLLPSQEDDVQRVERKRHIGNDVVVFVFLEQGCEPYLATKLTSQFIHIHFVIQKIPNSNPTKYRVAVVTKAGVEPHYPLLKNPSIFEKNKESRDFLLTKAINAERTTMLSPEFRTKMLQARKDFLKHLYDTYKKKK